MAKSRDTLTVTETLRKAIADSGLSGREVARRAGVDDRLIARFIKGERSLRGTTIDAVCSALGLRLTKAKDRHKG